MSEKCFHCKRSLNKKAKAKVDGKMYCMMCNEKLKKGEFKTISLEEAINVLTNKPNKDQNKKCKCNKSKCCNEKNSLENEVRKSDKEFEEKVIKLADKFAEEAANKFYEKNSCSSVSLSSTTNPMLSGPNTISLSLNTETNTLEEKKTYSKHICVNLDINMLKRILKEFFIQKAREDESRRTLAIVSNNVQIEYLQDINKKIKETM